MKQHWLQKALARNIEFYDAFSVVVCHSNLRSLFSSIKLKLNGFHLDVVTAFLKGKLDKYVFMEISEC